MFKSIKRAAGLARFLLFLMVGEFIRIAFPSPKQSKTLTIRLDAIGDFVIWLGYGAAQIAEMARRNGHSVLLAKQDWADMAESLNLFDEVWPVDTERLRSSPTYRFSLQLRVRRAGFSLVIQPRAAREFLLEDSIVQICTASDIIGCFGTTRNISARVKVQTDRWYTKLIRVPPESAHESLRSTVFCRELTGMEPVPVDIKFDAHIPITFGISVNYFILAPGAGWPGRRWPVERFSEIADRLHKQTGFMCVVIGSAQDKHLATAIVNATGSWCVDLTGRTTLIETGALLKYAHLAIVNESGSSHFSRFVGTKAIVLLGGGHFGWFMPYGSNTPEEIRPLAIYHKMNCFGCDWKCKYQVTPGNPVPCLDRVSVDEVWSAVLKVFDDNQSTETLNLQSHNK